MEDKPERVSLFLKALTSAGLGRGAVLNAFQVPINGGLGGIARPSGRGWLAGSGVFLGVGVGLGGWPQDPIEVKVCDTKQCLLSSFTLSLTITSASPQD